MRRQITAVLIAAMLLLNVYHAFSEQAGPLKFDFRAKPKDNHLTLICRAQNISEHVAQLGMHEMGPNFGRYSLHDPRRQIRFRGISGGWMINVQPHETWQTDPRLEEVFWTLYIPSSTEKREGRYAIISWNGIEICLGMPDIHGNMRAPVINPANPEVEMFLGFIFYHPIKAPDVCFLFLNGTEEAIEVENPLQAARITIKSPDIDYTDELHIRGAEPKIVTVEAGKVGEWKLPWRNIMELIPETALARINAAGGRFDLTWHAAGHQSLPLPVVLPQPGEKEWRLPTIPPHISGGSIP